MSTQTYLITGASSGLGRAVAEHLLSKGHSVILTARRENLLKEIVTPYQKQAKYFAGDILDESFLSKLTSMMPQNLSGAFINGGGPPAKTFQETVINDWDEAYHLLVRWKIQLIQEITPLFQKNRYGRILLSESTSVTRPVKNLVLSNSMRMVITGLVKTLVSEYKSSGITFNMLAPGYHETDALERLFIKLSNQQGIDVNTAKQQIGNSIPTGSIGSVQDYASFAAWLLGPNAGFVTGQVINIDGGVSV